MGEVSVRQIVCALVCAYGSKDIAGVRVLSETSGIDPGRVRAGLLDLCTSVLDYLAFRDDVPALSILGALDDPTEHLLPGPRDLLSAKSAVVHYTLEHCSCLPDNAVPAQVDAALYDLTWHLFDLLGSAWHLETADAARRVTTAAASYRDDHQ